MSSHQSTILVVDDEETMRRSLADILRLEGYLVQVAAGGEAAIAIMKSEPLDLVLLDLKMPGMDGIDVLRQMPAIAPQTAVILLTAHGSLESAIEALRQQAVDYLLKPSSPAQILSAVQRALEVQAENRAKQNLIEQLDSSLQRFKVATRVEQAPAPESHLISLGSEIVADLAKRQVWSEHRQGGVSTYGQVVSLTATETKLLRVLVEHAGQVLSHREIVKRVQGYDVSEWEAPEVLRPLVSRLRQKLSRFPGGESLIVNVRGTGYVFERRGHEEKGDKG